MFRSLAVFTAAVHFAYLAYVFFGGFLAARRPRTMPVHLVACTWALAVTVTPLGCPLTVLEDWFRAAAGASLLDSRGFIVHYLEGVLYAEQHTFALQLTACAVVLASWVYALRRRQQREALLAGERPS